MKDMDILGGMDSGLVGGGKGSGFNGGWKYGSEGKWVWLWV